jgi:hypothetical protein
MAFGGSSLPNLLECGTKNLRSTEIALGLFR